MLLAVRLRTLASAWVLSTPGYQNVHILFLGAPVVRVEVLDRPDQGMSVQTGWFSFAFGRSRAERLRSGPSGLVGVPGVASDAGQGIERRKWLHFGPLGWSAIALGARAPSTRTEGRLRLNPLRRPESHLFVGRRRWLRNVPSRSRRGDPVAGAGTRLARGRARMTVRVRPGAGPDREVPPEPRSVESTDDAQVRLPSGRVTSRLVLAPIGVADPRGPRPVRAVVVRCSTTIL